MDGATADANAVDDDGGRVAGDADLDGGPTDDCTRRCVEMATRCSFGAGDECADVCAAYEEFAVGCEAERDALYDCAFGPVCGACSLTDSTDPAVDALLACMVDRGTATCFAFCRVARAADCAPSEPYCQCIAGYYAAGTACRADLDTYYACAAESPCDRASACAAELEAAESCGCGAGLTSCAPAGGGPRTCANTETDLAHCGACGNVCPAGAACREGRCACPAGQIVCDGACADTTSDPANCGMCRRTCTASSPSRAECVGGSCGECGEIDEACCTAGVACTSPSTECNAGVCEPCGGIGQACCSAGFPCNDAMIEFCTAGRCECPDAACDGVCASTGWDPTNCGACGRACTPYEACRMGTCEPQACTLVAPQRYCAAGEGCYVLSAMTGERDCFPAGTGLDAAPCAARNECAAGLQCYTLLDGTTACRRFCRWRLGDIDCVGGGRCTGLWGGTPDLMDVGLCVP